MTIHIRFPHSSLVALGAACILLAAPRSANADTDSAVNVTARNCQSPVRLFGREGLKGVAVGSTVFGICLMLCKSPWPEIGLIISLTGAASQLCVAVGVMFGYCRYAEDHTADLMRAQRAQMARVLREVYGLAGGEGEGEEDGAREMEAVVLDKKETVCFDTHHGKLTATRAGDGYVLELDPGEKGEVRRAQLVRGTDIGGDWIEDVKALVGPEWADLVDSYR